MPRGFCSVTSSAADKWAVLTTVTMELRVHTINDDLNELTDHVLRKKMMNKGPSECSLTVCYGPVGYYLLGYSALAQVMNVLGINFTTTSQSALSYYLH